jgi:D-sedoheptulose 7-phosphate isomerase
MVSLFPRKSYSDVSLYLKAYASEVHAAFATIDADAIRKAAACLEEVVRRKATIFVCGNGGSAAIANHFVCDHVKGASTGTDFHPRVSSLSTNIEIVTAIANDMDYAKVFEFQLSKLADPGDVLVTISSSGQSPNIVAAIEWAKKHKITSIAMTGFGGGDARRLSDIALHVEAQNYGVVEDVHQSVMHILAQFLRQKRLFEQDQIGQIKF